MLKVYNAKMVPLYNEDKKIVHQHALWHKVVTGIVFNKQINTLYFQTIQPKDAYTFNRPDYIDFSIGGHVENDENINDAILREAKEELGLSEITPELSVMQDTEAPTIGSNVLASSTIPLMLFCAKAFIDNMRIRLIIICFFIFKIVQL